MCLSGWRIKNINACTKGNLQIVDVPSGRFQRFPRLFRRPIKLLFPLISPFQSYSVQIGNGWKSNIADDNATSRNEIVPGQA